MIHDIRDIHGCALNQLLAHFYTTAKGAYPDLAAELSEDAPGEECVLVKWGSHTLTITAWVDIRDESEGLTVTHGDSEQSQSGGPDPLDTVVALIAEHITEGGYDEDQGEAPKDAKPGTFAERVWAKIREPRAS